MDETTEPVIAVLGHPIAGNPSQFALERALESLPVDCRVLSLDVTAERLAAGLDGAEALGLRGVLLDAGLAPAAGVWAAARSGANVAGPRGVDCLYRDPADHDRLVAIDAAGQWLGEAIDRHFRLRGRTIENVVWVGPEPARQAWPPAERLGDPARQSLAVSDRLTADRLGRADLVVLACGGRSAEPRPPARRSADRWPPDDASTLVVDLTEDGHPDAPRLGQLGYHLLSSEQRRVAVLGECLRRWVGQSPPPEILREAIEEFGAV